jgi:hypothetical protein
MPLDSLAAGARNKNRAPAATMQKAVTGELHSFLKFLIGVHRERQAKPD